MELGTLGPQPEKSQKPVRALDKHWTGFGSNTQMETNLIMPYKDRLNKWLVVRLLPNMQRITVAHFLRHSDADGYLRIIRQLIPNAQFVIVFNAELNREAAQRL